MYKYNRKNIIFITKLANLALPNRRANDCKAVWSH